MYHELGSLLGSALKSTPVEDRREGSRPEQREKSICHTGPSTATGIIWSFVLGWAEMARHL